MKVKPLVPLFACSLALSAATSTAQTFPTRPVTLVVPFASGGTTDTEARLYTQKLQQNTGQPWVFDFKPGAGTTLGTGFVAKAAPDGYTLLLNNSGMTVFPSFYTNLSFDVLKDLAPITQLSDRVTSLVVSTTALPRVHNLKDLLAYAKANPGQLNCSTAGAGGISHIVCEALASAMGVQITPVHYKGAAQGAADLVAGRAHLNAGAYFNALPNIKAGKLRVVAILNSQRTRLLPAMPTAMEQGFDVEYPSWLGVFAPAGISSALVSRLNAEFAKAVRSPEVLKQLDAQGSVAVASTPEAFGKRMATELARWRKVIQEKKIRLD